MTYEEHGIDSEIEKIPTLPYTRAGHPGNDIFKAFVRIASLTKTAGLNQGKIGARAVRAAMAHGAAHRVNIPEREWWRQWRNAWRFASPRPGRGGG